jgi:hypothetical protein
MNVSEPMDIYKLSTIGISSLKTTYICVFLNYA